MSEKPLVIDLYGGLGGWAEGFLSEGYRCVGFDIEAHDYGTGGYPGELILRDVRSITGAELVREYGVPAVIVGSSPCQEFSYRAMPWNRAKALGPPHLGMELFQAQFRIQREACEAAGRYIPMVVENVRGAQKWVGRAKANFGSYYLWGDVGMVGRRVVGIVEGRLQFGVSVSPVKAQKRNPDGTEHGSGSWFKISDSKNRGARKNDGGSWFAVAHNTTSGKSQNPDGRKINGPSRHHELAPGEFGWHRTKMADGNSKSEKRKLARALIAKIPFPLAEYIAQCFKPAMAETLA